MPRRVKCRCRNLPAGYGAPEVYRCLEGEVPRLADLKKARELPVARLRCRETGLEWLIRGYEVDYGRYGWEWRLAPESCERLIELFRAGEIEGRLELVARAVRDAGRRELATALWRELLGQPVSFAEVGDALAGLLPLLEEQEAWTEILDRIDLKARPWLARYEARARLMLKQFEQSISTLLEQINDPIQFSALHHEAASGPQPETNDTPLAFLLLSAIFASGISEEYCDAVAGLALKWPRSMRLAFAAGVLVYAHGKPIDDWIAEVVARGEWIAGCDRAYPMPPAQPERIARSLVRAAQLDRIAAHSMPRQGTLAMAAVLAQIAGTGAGEWVKELEAKGR